MNNRCKRITAIFLCLTMLFACVLSGCSKEEKDNTKNRENVADKIDETKAITEETTATEPQTEAPTMKPTKAPTEAPTEKPTEKPVVSVEKSQTMLGFSDYTIEDIISIYGTEYEVSKYLYLGGAGSFYYLTRTCPYTFYFRSDVTTMGTIPSFKQKLTLISSSSYVDIDGVVNTDMDGYEVENVRPGGEWYTDVDSGYYVYAYNVGSHTVRCFWQSQSDIYRPITSVEVWFNR